MIEYNSKIGQSRAYEQANFARMQGELARQQARTAEFGYYAQTGKSLLTAFENNNATSSFTRRTEMTTEAPTLRTSIQVSPTATPAAALLPVAESVQSYFIKQRDNNEKLGPKKYYEMKFEADGIITKYKNNSDEFASVAGYNEEFGQYKKQELSQIKIKELKKDYKIY